MPFIEERCKVSFLAIIPTIILVESHHVRDELVGGVDIDGTRSQSSWIHLVGHAVESGDNLVSTSLDLIVQAPEADGRMIEVLGDHFAELEFEIVFKRGIGHPCAYKRNLFPHDVASAVCFLKHEPRLRVMRQAQ